MMKKQFCICGADEPLYVGSKDGIAIVKCGLCGLWYVPHLRDDYEEIYRSGVYQVEYERSIGHDPYSMRYGRDWLLAEKRLDKIQEFRESGKLLDVGCANGAFVHCAVSYGFHAFGIDLDKNADKIDRCCTHALREERDNNYDILTLHDVVEHFADPIAEFDHIARIVKYFGLVVIQSPDFSCDEFLEQGINWKHVRPRIHLYMLTPTIIDDLLYQRGFRVLERTYPIPGQQVTYAELNDGC